MHRKGLRPAIERDISHYAPNYKAETLWTGIKRVFRVYFGTAA